MKDRFLNLNHSGGKFLIAAGVLLAGIPGGVWLVGRAGIRAPALDWIARISFWSGAGLLLAFFLLVILEQWLDARLFHRYQKALNRRIPLGDGYAECPTCGFRRVRDFETACPACGKDLL